MMHPRQQSRSSAPPPVCRPAVFLDRDGVINRDSPDYIKSWSEFEFLPGVLDALAELTRREYAIYVISNQSAVGRGLISPAELERIFDGMRRVIASHGGRITDVFSCPHRPDEGCACRKPRPGLIAEACRRHPVDLCRAVMVGDSARDVACARNAGCRYAVRIAPETAGPLPQENPLHAEPDFTAPDLARAADWIIHHLDSPCPAHANT
ncbi:MAG TPA: HAD-IIIA family hydrolase [Desulfosalsimonadaceae bacterium]|nr:HAD-IIIA family hydrolase [Desulfosalsimonadaceae bacterium]